MKLSIGSNISVLQALRRLELNSSSRSQLLERLSSGLRINSASDDAASLAIASDLNVNARVSIQAIRNINDGISALNIGAAALDSLGSIVDRQLELAEQAANGVYNEKQRMGMQKEMTALNTEFNRIIDTTSFNDIDLLSSPDFLLKLQAGFGIQSQLAFNYASDAARAVGAGTASGVISKPTTTTAFAAILTDINNDGFLDVLNGGLNGVAGNIQIFIGNGNGTFSTSASYATASTNQPYQLAYGDVNGDGVKDIVTSNFFTSSVSVMLGNSNGSFQAGVTISTNAGGNGQNRSVSLGDVTGDGKLDIISSDLYTTAVWVISGNGDATFKAAVSYVASSGFDNELGDIDGDGDLDILSGSSTTVLINNGNGTFQARTTIVNYGGSTFSSLNIGDINGDGTLDFISSGTSLVVALGNGNGTFRGLTSYSIGSGDLRGSSLSDLNDDGVLDITLADTTGNAVYMLIGNGNGTFKASHSVATSGNSRNVFVGDFNNDFVNDIYAPHFASTGADVIFQNTTLTEHQGVIDISSSASSRLMLDKLAIDANRIRSGLSSIGGALSRLSSTTNYLTASAQLYKEAQSRIQDLDFASASADLVRTTILQNAAAAVLAHAAQSPKLLLSLLGE